MEHSPEPWRLLDAVPEHDVPWRIITHGANIAILCEEDEVEANGHRIVACVNACKGISTEVLEDGNIVVADLPPGAKLI